MSLNAQERARTKDELRANWKLGGLSMDKASADLDLRPGTVTAVLDMEPDIDPRLVWHVRDYIADGARAAGKTPVPFSVLTEDARRAAEQVFGI